MVPNQTPIPTDFFCIYATSVFRAQLLSTGSRWHSLIQTQTVFALHLQIGIRIWTYKSHTYIVQWVMTLGVTMRTWIQTKIVPSKWSQHICSRVLCMWGFIPFFSYPLHHQSASAAGGQTHQINRFLSKSWLCFISCCATVQAAAMSLTVKTAGEGRQPAPD